MTEVRCPYCNSNNCDWSKDFMGHDESRYVYLACQQAFWISRYALFKGNGTTAPGSISETWWRKREPREGE